MDRQHVETITFASRQSLRWPSMRWIGAATGAAAIMLGVVGCADAEDAGPRYSVVTTTEPDLSGWKTMTYGGGSYICERAWRHENSWDCYSGSDGGPPPESGWLSHRCTERLGRTLECVGATLGYYPGDLDDYSVIEFDLDTLLCKSGDCWVWDKRDDPSNTTRGSQDASCDDWGGCVPYGYELAMIDGQDVLCTKEEWGRNTSCWIRSLWQNSGISPPFDLWPDYQCDSSGCWKSEW